MKPIPYAKQYIDEDDIKAVVDVLRSDWITQGPRIKDFEDTLCAYTGAKYAVAVSNGTAALHIACLAADIKEGDEVITSPMTFAASANCVLYCGGKPVFADIDRDTANINTAEIRTKITDRVKALIPVHFAGHSCDMKAIKDIADEYGLTVIEDAAHALGAEYKGKKIGSCEYSDMTIFSFHPVKSITTGEGGAILTNRKDLYEKLMSLRTHGITKDEKIMSRNDGSWYYEQRYLGVNYRITDFQCVLGLSQMKKLDGFVKRRKEIAEMYRKGLSEEAGITLPVERGDVRSAWHIYCIRVKDSQTRKRVFDSLRDSGIFPQVHYLPVYMHPYYEQLGYGKGLCPEAEDFYQREISIPLYPSMTDEEVSYVIDKVSEHVRGEG
ncbi:MAG: UDP-4-amino-4,6-dideoxy-N-acetyl-beta-L-altrosamine transaminase [Candidatus Omnitrophota bacterium]